MNCGTTGTHCTAVYIDNEWNAVKWWIIRAGITRLSFAIQVMKTQCGCWCPQSYNLQSLPRPHVRRWGMQHKTTVNSRFLPSGSDQRSKMEHVIIAFKYQNRSGIKDFFLTFFVQTIHVIGINSVLVSVSSGYLVVILKTQTVSGLSSVLQQWFNQHLVYNCFNALFKASEGK